MNAALEAVKLIGGTVISIGVGALAKNLVKVSTPEDTKKLAKLCIGVGGFFVAGLAAKAASDRFEKTVDTTAKLTKKWIDGKEPEVVVQGGEA